MDTTSRASIRPSDHDERLTAAMNRARWELGDSSWGALIVGAYLWPDEDHEALKREEEDA